MRFSQSSQALFDASLSGDSHQAMRAISQLGDPKCCNAHGLRPLQLAIACGHAELVHVLLQAGAEVNVFVKNTPPPLVMAAGIRDVGIFQELLREGGDVMVADDVTGDTALIRAASIGDELTVGIILGRGSHEHQKLLVQRSRVGLQGDGATALHLAAAIGFVKICRDLLEADAEPNALDKSDHMPLYGAARGQHLEIAALLITFGADLSGCDRGSGTAMHVAAANGAEQMVQMLLRHGADVDALCRGGRTPLHQASAAGHGGICHLLLISAADPDAVDDSDETPFTLAFKRAHVQCCRALLASGASFPAVESARWAPPFTQFSPREHARLWKASDPEEDDLSRLFSC
jgi:ankyrin repeat protein